MNKIFWGTIFLLSLLLQAQGNNEILSERIRMHVESIDSDPGRFFCDTSLTRIYTHEQFRPFWNSREAFLHLLSLLYSAQDEGLNPSDYHFDALMESARRYDELEDEERAIMDIYATDGLLLFATHMLSGKLDPVSIDADWHVVRREGDPLKLVASLVNDASFDAFRALLEPAHDVYHQLKTGLKIYENIVLSGGWPQVGEGPPINPGETDERIPAMKERLLASHDLDPSSCEDSPVYDSLLIGAVKHFQARHGIQKSGIIGATTIEAMNVMAQSRLDQLKVNMERWRWLPREYGDFFIKVNIASFQMEVVRNGKVDRKHNIIVGRPTRNTPVFSSKMKYLVLNPTWTVPPGILKADLLPAQRKNSSYLNRKGIKVIDRNGNVVDPSTVDWKASNVYQYTYRQDAGASNALGAVKFMFDNPFHVYLHDTPSRELFASDERAFSSGCIRVEKPLELAEYLLEGKPGFDMDAIKKIITSKKTQTIHLQDQPEVYLLYWTAWVDEDGMVNFRKDIYNRDARLIEELDSAP